MTYPNAPLHSDSVNLGSNPSSPATGNADVSGVSSAPGSAEQSAQAEQTADTGRTETGTAHLRACTCHPSERPWPCERKYAFHDCWRAAVQEETQALIVALKNRDRNAYEQLMLDYAMRVRTALEV